jgi:microcystin-dependent protein
MSDPFIGQIALFGFNFAPRGWATCAGQIMPLSQNVALFTILGTTYGGNGQTTFALPDLRGSAAIGAGQGRALSEYDLGQTGGAAKVQLSIAQMPQHGHAFVASTDQATAQSPAGNLLARAVRPLDGGEAQAPGVGAPGPREAQANFYSPNPQNARTALAPSAIAPAGGDQPHNNMQPYLALNFCIALLGVMPQRG